MKRWEDQPWLIFGDFNEILAQSEKWGGRNMLEQQLTEFRRVLFDCELRDLGFTGPRFTWCNNRGGSASVCEKLDRFITNIHWCQFYPHSTVTHDSITYFDHCLFG